MSTIRTLLTGLALAVALTGCCIDADGNRRKPGESYTCADGCNTCSCKLFGQSNTQMWCIVDTGDTDAETGAAEQSDEVDGGATK
jgi:hypothetical protein